MFNNKKSEKQRWTLRKLTIGMASVMLGTTLFVTTEHYTNKINIVKADTNQDPLVDSSSDPNSLTSADINGLDNHVSSIKYIGHKTQTKDDNTVQDVYSFLDHNYNTGTYRRVQIRGIQGVKNNQVDMTYQGSDEKAEGLGQVREHYGKDDNSVAYGNPGAISETHLLTTAVAEDKLKVNGQVSNYVLLNIIMDRVDNNTAATFTGIGGASGNTGKAGIRNNGIDVSTQLWNASSDSNSTHFDPSTPSQVVTAIDLTKPKKTFVEDLSNLTSAEQDAVAQAIVDANSSNITKDKVSVDTKGNATMTGNYNPTSFASSDTVYTLNMPLTGVKDKKNLTSDDQAKIKDAIVAANKDNGVTADMISFDKDGNLVVNFGQGSDKNNAKIDEKELVYQKPVLTYVDSKTGKVDTDKIKKAILDANPTANVTVNADGSAVVTIGNKTAKLTPTDTTYSLNYPYKTIVRNKEQLTQSEKDFIAGVIKKANPDLAANMNVTVSDNGDATVTFNDGEHENATMSKDYLITEGNWLPNRTYVEKMGQPTDTEKKAIAAAIVKGNIDPNTGKSTITESDVTVASDGSALVNHEDGANPAYIIKEYTSYVINIPDITYVDDIHHITPAEQQEVITKIKNANPDIAKDVDSKNSDWTIAINPDGGEATITFGKGEKYDAAPNIPGKLLVAQNGNRSDKSDADKIHVNIPDKTAVDDIKNLTPEEKGEVQKKVEDANKDNFPAGTSVEIGNDGTATITFPDNSKKTIPGDQLVYPKTKDNQTDADKITPNVPDKTGVDNTQNLTPAEKAEVAQKVQDANKDNFPAGTKVEIGNDGTATITYPDGSKDTIPGSQLVYQKNNGNSGNTGDNGNKGNQTDADKITPNIPDKTGVNNDKNLTPAEKAEVAQKVEDANKDNFPAGTKVEIGNDGTAAITYPDGSKDTIPGSELVYSETPNVPSKVVVDDDKNLSPAEQAEVKKAVEDANNFPDGTQVDVAANGDVTVTYPNGVKKVIKGAKLVKTTAHKAKKHASKKHASATKSTNGNRGNGSNNNGQGVNGANGNTSFNRANNSNRLPQTGSNNSIFALIGAILISLASLMGFKRREK